MRDLRAVDGELEASRPERSSIALLHDVCGALDAARRDRRRRRCSGASARPAGASAEHMRRVRGRVETVRAARRRNRGPPAGKRSRRSISRKPGLPARGRCSSRRRRKRSGAGRSGSSSARSAAAASRAVIMPWTRGGEDDRRFRKSLARALLVCLLLRIDRAVHRAAVAAPSDEAGRRCPSASCA